MTAPERDNFNQRWQAYQALEALRTHWYWRPGWRDERAFYTWHITFEGQDALAELVTAVQHHLRLPELDLVPLEGLHLTTQGVGFTDEVSDEDLAAIIAAVTSECGRLPPFNLGLGPVDPDAEGVGLLIQPWQPARALRTAIRAGIGTVWSNVPEPAEGFRPHVTVAYSGADVPVHTAVAAIAPLRNIPPAIARIAEVQLIALRRSGRTYLWDVIHTAPLGSHRSAE
ncbi:2'-5' RNA ligase family protein [Dactylosporangium sp. NPDC005555]|uniref:2'-5' RNA ligase family protein n=1 Tax=Dactylosporangium sp. NPDC005555 TaxID=3154889 RepID=UPI0033B108DB